jgi:hypothetical protein
MMIAIVGGGEAVKASNLPKDPQGRPRFPARPERADAALQSAGPDITAE